MTRLLPRRAKTEAKQRIQQSLALEKDNVINSDFDYNFENIGFLNQGLVIKHSSLPNAGYGVFATRDYRKWDIVCEYSGQVAKWESSLTVASSTHTGDLNYDQVIHGWRYPLVTEKKNPGSMLNDAKDSIQTNCFLHLSDLSHDARQKYTCFENIGTKTTARLFIVAKRNIVSGSELFLCYGKKYWVKHG
jgi:hypothetical protein